MPLFSLKDLLAAMPAGARLIGLDPGARRIGVALSDVGRRIASPYGTILRGRLRQNAAAITAIAVKEGVGGLVIGLPVNEGAGLGPAAQAARDWAHAISAATGLPAAMQDESLTTFEAQAVMVAADVSRARRREVIDRLAAARILQDALDAAPGGALRRPEG